MSLYNADAKMDIIDVDSPLYQDTVLSYGIAPILNQLYKWFHQPKRPVWDIYLINVSTLVRNCLSIDRMVMEQVQRDMMVLAYYISSYVSTTHSPPNIPKLIFYYPTYKRIPDKYLLSPNKQYTKQLQIEHKEFPRIEKYTEQFGVLQTHHVPVGRHRLPHQEVMEYMAKIEPRYKYQRVCMLSSMPIDYHMYRYLPNFSIIRSHTAELMTKDTIGEKIFKVPVPFNSYTHLVLGDKKLIKNATTVKTKRLVLELSEKYRWKYQPEHAIYRHLLESKIIDKEYLKGLKF